MATTTSTITAETSIDTKSTTHSPQNLFSQLVEDLSNILGPSSGLDSGDVDPSRIEELMRDYESKTSDWQQYALADYTRSYTRNLVDKGNGKSNLLILVWTPGKGSPIHDHADAHCVMKVLRGSLRETLYDWPDKECVKDGIPSPPTVKKVTDFGENEVTYMSDQLGLHKISNPDPERVAVSLHLYTPPHAANRGCHIFDEKTGKPSRVMCVQFSEFGRKV